MRKKCETCYYNREEKCVMYRETIKELEAMKLCLYYKEKAMGSGRTWKDVCRGIDY